MTRGRPRSAPTAKWNAERSRWEVRVTLPTTPEERAAGGTKAFNDPTLTLEEK